MTNEWSDYIAHHGVLGMKWGVHRYRKQEGGFTKKGLKNLDKIASSEKKMAKHQKKAEMLIGDNTTYLKNTRDALTKYVSSHEKSKFKIRRRHVDEYKKKIKQIDSWLTRNDKLLKDVSSGKLKAGHDYLVQHDWNQKLFYIRVDDKLVFANPKNDVTNKTYFGPYGQRIYASGS